jgi:hypothetical protein
MNSKCQAPNLIILIDLKFNEVGTSNVRMQEISKSQSSDFICDPHFHLIPDFDLFHVNSLAEQIGVDPNDSEQVYQK